MFKDGFMECISKAILDIPIGYGAGAGIFLDNCSINCMQGALLVLI